MRIGMTAVHQQNAPIDIILEGDELRVVGTTDPHTFAVVYSVHGDFWIEGNKVRTCADPGVHKFAVRVKTERGQYFSKSLTMEVKDEKGDCAAGDDAGTGGVQTGSAGTEGLQAR